MDNESATRGLAYSVREGEDSDSVAGVLHDVPVSDLAAFLRFEGVLDKNFELIDDKYGRRYDVTRSKAVVLDTGREEWCNLLVGRCPVATVSDRINRAAAHREDLIRYVSTSIKGAQDFGIDSSEFQRDLDWVKNPQ